MRYPDYIKNEYRFPPFSRVRMDFPRPRIENIPKTFFDGLNDALAGSPIRAGDTVALEVGSRGIANFTTLCPKDADTIRAVILKDTLHTVEFLASKALFQELETIEQAQILEQVNLVFDERGNLIF